MSLPTELAAWARQCSICFDSQLDLWLPSCRDQFCRPCFERYIEEVVNNSWGIGVSPIKCPVCLDHLARADWTRFVPQRLIDLYDKYNAPHRSVVRTCGECGIDVPLIRETPLSHPRSDVGWAIAQQIRAEVRQLVDLATKTDAASAAKWANVPDDVDAAMELFFRHVHLTNRDGAGASSTVLVRAPNPPPSTMTTTPQAPSALAALLAAAGVPWGGNGDDDDMSGTDSDEGSGSSDESGDDMDALLSERARTAALQPTVILPPVPSASSNSGKSTASSIARLHAYLVPELTVLIDACFDGKPAAVPVKHSPAAPAATESNALADPFAQPVARTRSTSSTATTPTRRVSRAVYPTSVSRDRSRSASVTPTKHAKASPRRPRGAPPAHATPAPTETPPRLDAARQRKRRRRYAAQARSLATSISLLLLRLEPRGEPWRSMQFRHLAAFPRGNCACGAALCWHCGENAHHVGLACSEYRALQVQVLAGGANPRAAGLGEFAVAQGVGETLQWTVKHSKPCPQCKVWIVRDEGCNRVDCLFCGMAFCWQCASPWSEKCGFYNCKTTASSTITSAASASSSAPIAVSTAPAAEGMDLTTPARDVAMPTPPNSPPEIGVPDVARLEARFRQQQQQQRVAAAAALT
ncbi:Ankyrin repeat and IBR domain-containing protein 1 [Allomyces arbusculus]|nr:Ankyrin repeat and IBR domain-containing protein 1 [Allomyces arbusculus]